MITTLVEFDLPEPMTVAQAQAVFAATAPRYLGLPGLLRKHYVLSEDGRRAGGVYLWATRADAERLYTEAWKDFVRQKYGCEPRITYLATPVVVDNAQHVITTSA